MMTMVTGPSVMTEIMTDGPVTIVIIAGRAPVKGVMR